MAGDHLSFLVRPGEVTGFLDPNEVKSTTTRMIVGLDTAAAGQATVDGCGYRELPDNRRQLAPRHRPSVSSDEPYAGLPDRIGLTLAEAGEVLDVAVVTASTEAG